jgi:hypothetical protein
MLFQVATMNKYFAQGEVYEVDNKQGKDWCNKGLAIEDKSQDGAPETKMTRGKAEQIK